MKNSIKKSLTVALSLAIMGSAMVGCKSEGSDGTKPEENPNATPTTLTVELFDRAKAGQPDLTNNYWTKYIEENFSKKYNTKVQFVTVPRTQEVDKLNVMMAAGEAPDICFTYDNGVVYNYVKQDGLADLTELVKKYGQNLTKNLGKDVLNYGVFNEKQMAIPARRTVLANSGEFIRQDWLDKLGMKAPTNKAEFEETLKAFKDQNPGKVDGVVPWAVGGDAGVAFKQLVESFWTKMSDKDFACLPEWQKPGNKEGVKFVNKLYNEKLISTDFAIDKTGKQSDADNSNGKSGFCMANWDFPYRANPGIADNLKKNVPGASFVPIDTFENYDGKYFKNEYAANGIFNIIPKSSKNKIQAVQYLNWLADPEVTFFMQNGEENVTYKTVDGVPSLLPLTGDKQMTSTYNLDYNLLFNGMMLGSDEKNTKALMKTYPGYEDLAIKALKIASTDTYKSFNWTIPSDANAKYAKALADKRTEMYAKLVVCKPEEFDKLYDSLVQEYMAAGGQAVKDDYMKIYDQMKKK